MKYRFQDCFSIGLLVVAGLVGSAAAQAEPSAADKETARALHVGGRAKLAAGEVKAALESFQAAHAIMKVPTTGLDVARAQAALGLLIEARDTALEVTRLPSSATEPEAFTDARAEAAKLADELGGRISSIVVRVRGLPANARASIRVDGAEIPTEALTLPRKANPGAHVLEVATSGVAGVKRVVTLREGEAQGVEISLSPPNAPGPPSRGEPRAIALGVPARRSGHTWAWVAGGVGIAALGVGIGFAVDYAGVRSTIAEDCPEGVCSSAKLAEANGALARWNRDLGLMVGMGATGVVGVVVGAVGISRRADGEASKPGRAVVAPWVGLRTVGAGIGGKF